MQPGRFSAWFNISIDGIYVFYNIGTRDKKRGYYEWKSEVV